MAKAQRTWQTVTKYLGLGPTEACGRMDRDEILERFDGLERRIDELAARLDDAKPPEHRPGSPRADG